MSKHGEFIWNEFSTHDVEKAKRFYSATLGWEFDEVPDQGGVYNIIKQDGKMLGGIFEMKGPVFEGLPAHWLSYISVDDVDARIGKALEHGGESILPVMDVPDIGRFGKVKDPCGGIAAWITPFDLFSQRLQQYT